MDWAAAQENVRKWFAEASRIELDAVSFDGEPVGFKPQQWAELAFETLEAPQETDELRMTAIEGDDTRLALEQVGNRGVRLVCMVRSRDRHATKRAPIYLERVRNKIELPAAQEAFEAAGLALRETFAIAEVGVDFDNREESQAVLEIAFNYASSSLDEDGPETVERLAGVRYSGRAQIPGGPAVIVPERQVPEEAP